MSVITNSHQTFLVHGLPTRIVVPIFNAYEATKACLDALLRHTPTEVSIALYDDASTDAQLAAHLQERVSHAGHRLSLIRQERNVGFVANCNRAMADSTEHVLLLNSDTQVTAGWWQAMLDVAASSEDVASVTPFSNNAEICSFPELCKAAPAPENLDIMGRAFAHNTAQPVALPTAVGFCMWINRHALVRVGNFDHATFGRGYGEENDWCCRATGHGYRHLLAPQAYVVHLGGQSFGPLGERPGGQAMTRLLARYPHYGAMIQDFIERDPVALARQAAAQSLAEHTESLS